MSRRFKQHVQEFSRRENKSGEKGTNKVTDNYNFANHIAIV